MLMNRIVVVLMLLVATAPAHADVIYDNGVTPGTFIQSDGNFTQIVDDFSLGAGANTITDVHWTGVAFPGFSALTEVFRIAFFASTVNTLGQPIPESTPFVSQVVSPVVTPGPVTLGQLFYEYYAVLPDEVELAPDTRFWISIVHDEAGECCWQWSGNSSPTDPAAVRFSGTTEWIITPFALDFALTNDFVGTPVPEPSTLLLLGVGVGAAAGAMRIRRRK